MVYNFNANCLKNFYLKKYFSLVLMLIFVFLVSCNKNNNEKQTSENKKIGLNDLAQFVDPMIGTAKMGHTYPGATLPFGSVQLSPDTDTIPYSVDGHYNPDVYKYCAGYQ
jgi:putative alpha-1,2-mannosidase